VDDTAHAVWVAGTAYTSGDVVSPITANSHFFRCLVSGTSDTVEPDWLAGESSVTDGTVTWERFEVILWKCVPDTKPGVGKNYRTYWVEDDSLISASSSAYSTGTEYLSGADFLLADDELYLTAAHIRYEGSDLTSMAVLDYKKFMQDATNRTNLGTPDAISIEVVDLYSRRACVCPIPLQTGADGYVLHYEVVLKTSSPDDQNADMEYLDGWFLYLEFQLAANLAPEYGLPIQEKIYLDKKAEKLYNECKTSDDPKVTERKVRSCY
jgi:hypothetical protein